MRSDSPLRLGILGCLLAMLERFAIILHVIDIFLGVAGLSLVAIFVAILKLVPTSKPYFWLSLLLLVFTSCLLIIAILIRSMVALRRHSKDLNAHVVEEFRCASLSVGKMRSRQKLTLHLRALDPCIQHYWIQFKWTGSEPAKLTVLSQGAQLLGPVPRMTNDLTYYLVAFENPLPKSGFRLLEIEYDLEDSQMCVRPYLGIWAFPNRKKFELKVTFPTDPPAVYKIIHGSHPENQVGEPEQYEFHDHGRTASWLVEKPVKDKHYTLNWSQEYVRNLPDSVN